MTKPHNLDAEQGLLGAAIDAPRLLERVSLDGKHFYDPTHGALWTELQERRKAGRLIDGPALREFAERTFAEIGGVKYVMKLLERQAPLQAVQYGELIRDCWRRRQIIAEAQGAIALAQTGEADGEAVQARLEQALQTLSTDEADSDAWDLAGSMSVEAVGTAKIGAAAGLSTGIRRLDELTGGIQPGTLWVIGGATSMGKSVMGQHLSRAVASQGYGVGEFHLEMDRTQIGLRMASALAADLDHRVTNAAYLAAQRNQLAAAQWAKLEGAARALGSMPIYIDARPGRSLSQIEAGARRLFGRMRREGVTPGAIIIDHEGLVAPETGARFPSQLERTNARSEGLLAMAKRLGCGVIALSQITKEGSRADGEERLPTAHDLNYGGAISQAASVVILIHRIAYHEKRKPEKLQDPSKLRSREAVLVVDKVRGGETGQCTVLMDLPTSAIFDPEALNR